MEVKPVKHVENPKYPLKTEIKAEELKKRIPKRWAQSPAAKVALGTLAAVTLAGCTADGKTIPPSAITKETSPSPTEEYILMGEPLAPAVMVAPLFVHGEGRGAFGCVMVAPPIFLSEEDALSVINEVAEEYGLKFSGADGPELTNVIQPDMDLSPDWGEDGPEKTKGPEKVIRLKADFADSGHDIAIEYISIDDVREWGQPSGSTLEEYDTKDAADQLSDALEQAVPADYGFYTMGVLYDPCEKSESEMQLKKQAADFFEWLKSQGVI